ncbi:hypothetical protein Tco_1290009, partial [Tanacetum coccineum]
MAYDAAGVGSSILLSSSKSRHDYDKRLLEAESRPPKTAGPSGRPKKTAGPSGRPKKTAGPSARPKKTTGRSSRNQATYLHSPATKLSITTMSVVSTMLLVDQHLLDLGGIFWKLACSITPLFVLL